MADTTTATYSFVKPELNGSDETWDEKLNDNFDLIDAAIKAATGWVEKITISVAAANVDITLPADDCNYVIIARGLTCSIGGTSTDTLALRTSADGVTYDDAAATYSTGGVDGTSYTLGLVSTTYPTTLKLEVAGANSTAFTTFSSVNYNRFGGGYRKANATTRYLRLFCTAASNITGGEILIYKQTEAGA